MTHCDQKVDAEGGELGFRDIIDFFGANWRSMAGMAFVGAAAAAGFLALTPKQHEANAMVEMARVPSSQVGPGASVESAALLVERLRMPSTYTPEAMKACGLDVGAESAESLALAVKTTLPRNLSSVANIAVRRDGPELAGQCVNAVFEMIHGQQMTLLKPYYDELRTSLKAFQARLHENQSFMAKMEKSSLYQVVYLARRDTNLFLREKIDELERSLARDSQPRLVAPIHVSSKAVYPKRGVTLVLGALAGLMLGLVIALGRRVLAKR